MTELQRLQHIRTGFRNKASQYRVMADATDSEHVRILYRGMADGFDGAATDLTQAIKAATDELWQAGIARLDAAINGRAA